MKRGTLAPIPIPAAQRIRHFKASVLPALVFVGALIVAGILWKQRLTAPVMIGQAEGEIANVTTHQAGVLTDLHVNRFQKVRAGDVLGQVVVADPKLIEASLALIRSELETLQAELTPIIPQRRYMVDYAQLRMGWMRQRADLVVAKVNLQLAEVELRRNEELFKDKIISPSLYDFAKATRDAIKTQVEELTRLVAEGEAAFKALSPENPEVPIQSKTDPLQAALVAQDAKLRLAEAQMSPIELRAPIDGTITAINFRSGESVTAGQFIVTIAADQPSRIVGYIRQPIRIEPQLGARVMIHTRGATRAFAPAQIMDVGAQLDAMPMALQSSVKLTDIELALPVNISIPPGLKLRPGEFVDITLTEAMN